MNGSSHFCIVTIVLYCMQRERACQFERAEELQKQCGELFRDNETQRKSLQNKVHYVLQLLHNNSMTAAQQCMGMYTYVAY